MCNKVNIKFVTLSLTANCKGVFKAEQKTFLIVIKSIEFTSKHIVGDKELL